MSESAPSVESAPGRPPSRAATIAGALLPWRLFFGPVFQKEMRVSGRKLSTYLARTAYALILALVVVLTFWQAWEASGYTDSASGRLQSLQNLAPSVVVAVLWFQFVATLLLAPVMASGTICDERRAQTLPTLLTTPLTALEIVCSKMASRLAHLLILALLALPILLGIRLFGGVRAETILAGAALTISCAILAAAVGVLASTLSRRGTIAALLTYIFLFAIFLAPPMLAMRYNAFIDETFGDDTRLTDLIGESAPDWPATIPPTLIIGSSPPAAMGVVTIDPPNGIDARTLWVGSTIYTLVLALGSTLLASASVRRTMRRSIDESAPRRRRRRKRGASPDAEPEPARLSHRRSRTVSDRPVFWRELRQPLFNRRRTFAFAVVVVLIVALLTYPGNLHDQGVAMIPVGLGMILLVLQAALLSAPGFAAEREARTLDTLLTTRLRASEIVWGKALGAVRKQWFLPLLLMLHAGLLVVFGAEHWLLLVQLPIIMLGPIVMLAGTGVYFGLRFRKTVTASGVNLALALALWLGWPILMGLLFGALEVASYDVANAVASVTLFLNPIAIPVVITEGLHGVSGLSLDAIDYDLPMDDPGPLVVTALLVVCSGAQAGVGLLAARLAQARFSRYTGRTS
ncbi:MAG: ABC transporter permease subunit [Phycisphaerales bacterium]